MRKKKKSRFRASEDIKFNENWRKDTVYSEWFYMNNIVWYKAIDGRIVAPVSGVVMYVEPPEAGYRTMSKADAEQCVVEVAPFGRCYEKRSLEALWDSLNGRGAEGSSEDVKNSSEDVKDCTDDGSECLSESVKDSSEDVKDCTDEPEKQEKSSEN